MLWVIVPPIRSEFISVVAIQVFPTMHSVDAVTDCLALANEYRGLAVWPAAQREDGRFESLAHVYGNRGVQAKNCG